MKVYKYPRWLLAKHLLISSTALITLTSTPAIAEDVDLRVARILKKTPLIDGHNDWAEVLREREGTGRWSLDLRRGLSERPMPYNTDIERLRKGLVGGQFWSVYVSADLPGPVQVEQTLDQIDLVKDIVRRFPTTLALARTASDVRRIHASGRIASMIGVEGGGQIDNDLSVLRAYHELGAGYLTLSHMKTIEWVDSATDLPLHGGLTSFGRQVVGELNRLGMLVDLSHVSEASMRDALQISKAPVIFSHSSARAIDDHPRNVSDAILKLVSANRGVVMVNFDREYISESYRQWAANAEAEKARLNTPPYGGIFVGQPAKAAAAFAEWQSAHPAPLVTMSEVADHIEHIVKVAGVDSVGIGSDFDGVDNDLPRGLEGVDTFPILLKELMRRGWSDGDIAKVAGNNILRVMGEAERVAGAMSTEPPFTASERALDTAANP